MKRLRRDRQSNSLPYALHETQAGQSLVEISLILPLVIIFLLIAANVGLGLRAHDSVTQAVQQSAEILAHGDGTNPPSYYDNPISGTTNLATYINTSTNISLQNAITASEITITPHYDTISVGGTAATVQVDTIAIDYPFKLIAPLLGGFNWGALRSGTLHVGSTASTAVAFSTPPTINCVNPAVAPTVVGSCATPGVTGQHTINWTAPTNPNNLTLSYCVYRDYIPATGSPILDQRVGCTSSTAFTDSPPSPAASTTAGQKNFTYTVTVVEADGIESAKSSPGYGQ